MRRAGLACAWIAILLGGTALVEAQSPSQEFAPAYPPTEYLAPQYVVPPGVAPPFMTPPPMPVEPLPEPPRWFRGFGFTAAWFAGDGDQLGMTDLEAKGTWEFPLRTPYTQLAITPLFGMHLLSGPNQPDLPPRLYDLSLDIAYKRPLSKTFFMELAVRPGMYGDYETINSDTWRFQGRAIGFYQWRENWQLVGGFNYLDREDYPALPVGGAIWTPTPDQRYEILFPRPKLARRICGDGDRERWVYLLGEFGGYTYTIERADLTQDVVTLRDLRLIAGIESKLKGGFESRLEAGYVFGRRVEYESATPDFEPSETAMVRIGLAF